MFALRRKPYIQIGFRGFEEKIKFLGCFEEKIAISGFFEEEETTFLGGIEEKILFLGCFEKNLYF